MSDSNKKEVRPLGSLDALGSLLAPGSAAVEEKERQRKEQVKKERAAAAKVKRTVKKAAAPAQKPIAKRVKQQESSGGQKIKRQVYLSQAAYDAIEKTHFSIKRAWRNSHGRGEITESLFIEACIQMAMEQEAGKPGQIIKMLEVLKDS